MTEEQNFDGHGQTRVQDDHTEQQDLAGLLVRGADDGVEVLDQEEDGDDVAEADEGVVQAVQGTPAHQGHHDPEEVRVAVQGPALDHVDALRAEPAQRPPQAHRHQQRVAVHQAGRTGEEFEIILEMFSVFRGQLVGDGTGEEEDDHDSGGDPERPVQVRIAVQGIEEGWGLRQEREEGVPTTGQHSRGVDVEELRVEGQGPEHVFLLPAQGTRRVGEMGWVGGGSEERRAVWSDFGRGIGEIWQTEKTLSTPELFFFLARVCRGRCGKKGTYWKNEILGHPGGLFSRDHPARS